MPPIKQKETVHEEPTTPEQAKQYDKLIGRFFIRVDPTTSKAHEEAKEFLWDIRHTFRSTLSNASGFRTMFQIQKLHRNVFIEVQQRLPNGSTATVKKNKPWNVYTGDEEGMKSLHDAGDRLIDAADFVKQFRIDKTVEAAEKPIMEELSAFDDAPAAGGAA
jgi:hypothetical protein